MIDTAILAELYGTDLGDFVTTRTRLSRAARESGDRALAAQIGELRKPTVGAWALNQLVRSRPAETDRLLDLGTRMREAQARLDMDVLRGLRTEREQTLDNVTRAARFVADDRGQPLSMDVTAAIRGTCVAVLADAHAATALQSGALIRTLDYAGFGEVDLDDAVAAAGAPRDTLDAPPFASAEPSIDPAESAAARTRLTARLREELQRTDQELARASLVEADRIRQAEKAAQRVAELARLLEAAQDEARLRADAADTASRDRADASDAHTRARERLDALGDA